MLDLPRHGGRLAGRLLLLGALLPGLGLADPAPLGAQEAEEASPRVAGIAFSDALVNAIEGGAAISWDQVRNDVAVTLEGDTQPTRLVVHLALVREGGVTDQFTSEPFEILPGATKFSPEDFFPSESMLPGGEFQAIGVFGPGAVDVPAEGFIGDFLMRTLRTLGRQGPVLLFMAAGADQGARASIRSEPAIIRFQPAAS